MNLITAVGVQISTSMLHEAGGRYVIGFRAHFFHICEISYFCIDIAMFDPVKDVEAI